VLYRDRRDLTARPLRDRHARLEDVVANSDLVFPVRRLAADGLEAWKQVVACGYEGYVANDEASAYEGARTRRWLKVKQKGWTVEEDRWRRRGSAPALVCNQDVAGSSPAPESQLHWVMSEHVALVGRTGAGKTSALHLVAGLYPPWSGSIRVAGRDPVRLDESERRRVLGVVPQVVQLFSGTVMENLTLSDPSLPDAAVYEACRIAGPDAFIRALPQGYHTDLSGSGSGTGAHLSAGTAAAAGPRACPRPQTTGAALR
jgi:ABC transporter/ATP dependent DNA ligase domain